jgi:hypothetical protein
MVDVERFRGLPCKPLSLPLVARDALDSSLREEFLTADAAPGGS